MPKCVIDQTNGNNNPICFDCAGTETPDSSCGTCKVCETCFIGVSKEEVNNYPFYDGKWNSDPSVNPPSSISAYPGLTNVSLSWTAPPGGLSGSECGYVVVRSTPGGSAPTNLDQSNGNVIVHVGTGTFFGDRPLTKNTTDLMTTDAGLLSNTTYWYSVFVVTTIPPQTGRDPTTYVRGLTSTPLSIQVKTLDASVLKNLLMDPDFQNIGIGSGSNGWIVDDPNATINTFTSASPVYDSSTHYLVGLDPNDFIIQDENGKLIFSEFVTVRSPPSSCQGTCDSRGTCNKLDGSTIPSDPDCASVTQGTPCDCAAGAVTALNIYQIVKGPDGGFWIPGKLYSLSIWYRTNNPITAAEATNGNNQSYTPVIRVVGVPSPSEKANKDNDSFNGITQMEQTMINEGSYGSLAKPWACSTTDSVDCKRLTGAPGNSPNFAYSSLSNVWQRASFSFTIGAKYESEITTAYNVVNGIGDPPQSPVQGAPASTLPSDWFSAIYVNINIPANAAGLSSGRIDLAHAELYEGILPYTDPYWYMKPEIDSTTGNTVGPNLILNPNFWGVATDTQGTTAPGWICPSALGLDTGEDVCGYPCNGKCLICVDQEGTQIPNANCTNECSTYCIQGACQPTPNGVSGGTCSGNCAQFGGSCVPSTSFVCGGEGNCSGTCTQSGATCTVSGGTCAGSCTGTCNYKAPTCHGGTTPAQDAGCLGMCTNPPGPCTCLDLGSGGSSNFQCVMSDGVTNCNDSYNTICPNNTCTGGGTYCNMGKFTCDDGSGDCEGNTCAGACTSICPEGETGSCSPSDKYNLPTCSGTCMANGGYCSGGTGSCSGGAVCFNTNNSIYANLNGADVSGICPSLNLFAESELANLSTYYVLHGCECQQVNLQQGNIYGLSGYYSGSFYLAQNSKYQLSFDYAVLQNTFNNGATKNFLTVTIVDGSGTINILPDAAHTSSQSQVDFTQVVDLNSLAAGSVTFQTATIEFTTGAINANPNIRFSLYKIDTILALKNVQLRNVSSPLTNELYGIQNQIPAIVTLPQTTSADLGKNQIVWSVPGSVTPSNSAALTSEDCPQSVLFYDSATTQDGTKLGWPQGLVLMNAFHTAPTLDMISIVADKDPELSSILGAGNQNVMAITVENINGNPYANQSNFLMSNSYYGSGQWDIWVKIADVFDGNGKSMTNPDGTPVNPTGCSFAFWVYHAISYEVTGGPKLLYEANPLRNTEIDIEMNGACPDYSNNYENNTGRLNGWGGQWGGSGANFTMHTMMPNGISLNDGKYHKLSIIFHSGYDMLPNEVDPNANPPTLAPGQNSVPTVRNPGFVKWLVDDVEWGCGWTGNAYGQDNIPMTATRIVAGPWNPDWAGCSVCCGNKGFVTPTSETVIGCNGCNGYSDVPGNCCPEGATISPGQLTGQNNPPAVPTNNIPLPKCNVWTEALFYIAKMQFTPTCVDCPISPPSGATYTYPYYPSATVPNRPDATIMPGSPAKTCTGTCSIEAGCTAGEGVCPTPSNIPPSNRNRYLPETKPYLTFTTEPPQPST